MFQAIVSLCNICKSVVSRIRTTTATVATDIFESRPPILLTDELTESDEKLDHVLFSLGSVLMGASTYYSVPSFIENNKVATFASILSGSLTPIILISSLCTFYCKRRHEKAVYPGPSAGPTLNLPTSTWAKGAHICRTLCFGLSLSVLVLSVVHHVTRGIVWWRRIKH
ncbi:hypothetical protein FRC03_008734 [Tulasnella sp. 419]|nr:hypothetical protein FRC03_008734 [Tulasnella sp. 419]